MSHTAKEGGKPNRLIHETSPYLLQHAYNPVDWHPWGTEALERAKQENKPILLSIGYSACHWCHVMERESFENEQIAAIMNQNFVNIKVDREERPDLDHIYQTAAQLLGGGGGWPLTVCLKPDQRPFYAGTYFPPQDRWGRLGFPKVLESIARIYREEPDRVAEISQEVTERLAEVRPNQPQDKELPEPALIDEAATQLLKRFDDEYGGFGSAPKFPNTDNIALFFRHARRSGDLSFRDRAFLALRKMAQGGIYDQIGGGFHRYSVDEKWLVPHFEKMLYDNALLPPLYITAYQWTGKSEYARIVHETLDYVLREMTDPQGGFYSTEDADSEGEEGKFYVWTPDEITQVLGDRHGRIACAHWCVTPEGNFEHGTTVLHVSQNVQELAETFRASKDEIEMILKDARARLFAAREKRPRPFRDEKILSGWNGLMISAMARAAQSLPNAERFGEAAVRAAEFVLGPLTAANGQLLRSFKGKPSAIPGYLEDYAFVIAGLLDVYEATFRNRYFSKAVALAEVALLLFGDPDEGGFYLTPLGHEELIQRPKDDWDQSVPSGNGVMAMNLLRLHALTGNEKFRRESEGVLARYRASMKRSAWGTSSLLAALDFASSSPTEITLVGPLTTEAGRKLRATAHGVYLPNRVVAGVMEEDEGRVRDPQRDGAGVALPVLLEGRPSVEGQPTAYVCENYTCSAPVTDPEALVVLLGEGKD